MRFFATGECTSGADADHVSSLPKVERAGQMRGRVVSLPDLPSSSYKLSAYENQGLAYARSKYA